MLKHLILVGVKFKPIPSYNLYLVAIKNYWTVLAPSITDLISYNHTTSHLLYERLLHFKSCKASTSILLQIIAAFSTTFKKLRIFLGYYDKLVDFFTLFRLNEEAAAYFFKPFSPLIYFDKFRQVRSLS